MGPPLIRYLAEYHVNVSRAHCGIFVPFLETFPFLETIVPKIETPDDARSKNGNALVPYLETKGAPNPVLRHAHKLTVLRAKRVPPIDSPHLSS